MILDNEQQRQMLLQLIDAAQFPGTARKVINKLGDAIEAAGIMPTDESGKEGQSAAKITGT